MPPRVRRYAVADAVRAIGMTEETYYRWRQEFGGLKTDQMRRMEELKAENARLRAVSDLTSPAAARGAVAPNGPMPGMLLSRRAISY